MDGVSGIEAAPKQCSIIASGQGKTVLVSVSFVAEAAVLLKVAMRSSFLQ